MKASKANAPRAGPGLDDDEEAEAEADESSARANPESEPKANAAKVRALPPPLSSENDCSGWLMPPASAT